MAQDSEKENLEKFEAKLKENKIELDPEIFDKYTTIRFLRARKQDVDASYLMLTNHLAWRKANGVDDILETAPLTNKNFKNLDKYWPGQYAGVDKDGVPVWIDRAGQIDADGILASIPMDDFVNYHIYATEKTMKLKKEISEKLGKNCYQGVVIEDLEGFGRSHMGSSAIEIFKRINQVNADNYPECLKVFYAINSPMLVSAAYKLVKSFIDPETRKKVFVLGNKYTDELMQYIEKDQILKEYGGTNDKLTLKGGGKYSDAKKDGTTYNPASITIGAGGKVEVNVTVKPKYKGVKVSWTLLSGSGDIKFAVDYKGADGKGKKEEIVANKSVDPSTGEIKGEFTATNDGVYTFLFDNSHAWVKSKSLRYWVHIEKPRKEESEEEPEEKDAGTEGKKKRKKKKKTKSSS